VSRLRGKLAPYLMVLPAWLWLAIFFVVPTVTMLSVSTMTGNDLDGFKQTFHFSTYADAWNDYHTQIVRSLIYGLVATVLCVLIGYPVAYWIAFYGGRHKSTLLFLLLLPFFVSFVIRTLAWETLLQDEGVVIKAMKHLHIDGAFFGFMHFIGAVPEHAHQITQTHLAVVGGLVYNFLPFTILPIYVSLERVSPSLLESSADLYGNKVTSFTKVVLPLSMPGVFAGVLLTFVPVAADYVTAQILGGPGTTMVGTIIDQRFNSQEYPIASALSFILMALLLIGVFSYAKALGTEEAMEMAAA